MAPLARCNLKKKQEIGALWGGARLAELRSWPDEHGARSASARHEACRWLRQTGGTYETLSRHCHPGGCASGLFPALKSSGAGFFPAPFLSNDYLHGPADPAL